jgi:hypothetical protein
MKIEDKDGDRILSLCGTVLNQQKIIHCEACGATMGPLRYLEYVRKRTDVVGAVTLARPLCDVCSRKAAAEAM